MEDINRKISMLKRISRTLACLSMCASMPAMSTIIYLPGDTVDFYYDDAAPGMSAFGNLSVVGNSIFATPANFQAESLNGTISLNDSFSAMGTVMVVAHTGYRFDAIQVAQQGDYKLNGTGASVSTTASLTVEDSSNAAITTTGPLSSTSDFTINDNALHDWSSSIIVDLDNPTWLGTTSIDLSLDTLLSADTSTNGETAFIQNKFVGGGFVTIMTTPIPVPAAIWLMIGGLLALTGAARKKS